MTLVILKSFITFFLEVPKSEIFDCSYFHDCYTIQSQLGAILELKLEIKKKNFSFGPIFFLFL
jgi:hypothetical protein